MQPKKSRTYLTILFLILVLQGACASGLQGTIYLDENGNSKKDDGELLLAGLTFTVSLDGEEIDTGITDATGYFEVEMDGKGEYCVEVSSNDLETSNVTRVASLWSPLIKIKNNIVNFAIKVWNHTFTSEAMAQTTTEDDCNDSDDNDDDGFEDCDDTDCSGDASCVADDCIATDSDTDGIPDCSESVCSSESVCDTSSDDSSDSSSEATITNGSACKTASGLILELDVPVAIDYATTITDLDDTETAAETVGGSFDLNITYPINCTLKQSVLPDFVQPASASIRSSYFTASTHKLDLQGALDATDEAGLCTDTAPETPAYDTLRTCPLSLSVIDNGIIGSEEDTMVIATVCPDDETYTITTVTIQKDADNDIEIDISQDDADGDSTWEAGDDITATVVITNNSSTDLDSADFDFDITTPSSAQNQAASISSGTCTGSQSISCTFDIASEASVTVTVTYDLPSTITTSTDFETIAILSITETSTEFTESSTITVD